MSARGRGVTLVLAAAIAVAAVIGTQLALGGGDFVAMRPANPCEPRPIPSIPARLDAVAEAVVVTGIDATACNLDMSRERLVLMLGDPRERAQIDPEVLRRGLLSGLDRLDGKLPPVSKLLPEVLAGPDVSGLIKTAAKNLSPETIDGLVQIGPLMRRAIQEIDMRAVIGEIEDVPALDALLREAIIDAARAEVLDGLPGPLRGLLR